MEQFEAYVTRLGLPELGRAYLQAARNGTDAPATPSRAVGSKNGNLIVRYPSAKNEKVLSCERRRVDLAIALVLENDETVLEFLTQPPAVEVNYLSPNQRAVAVQLIPTFLVLYRDRIELVEGKTSEDMPRLVSTTPGRYSSTGAQVWQSVAGQETAKSYGFTFRIWTDADFSREYIRNLKHLDPYLKLGSGHFPQETWQPVADYVLRFPGLPLEALAASAGAQGFALVRWMLAHRHIYCNLDKYVLANPKEVRLYPNAAVAKAMEALHVAEPTWSSVLTANPAPQSPVLEKLTGALLQHTLEDFERANRRLQVITGQIPKEQWDASQRIVNRWKKAYKAGGYLALLDNRTSQGNRALRQDPRIITWADDLIEQHFLKPPKKKVPTVYRMFLDKCVQAGLSAPSSRWFYRRIDGLEIGTKVLAQEGSRAAYPYQFNPHSVKGLWDSRGDYPFMDVHCDHTELSIFLKSEKTGQLLGKPWLTVLIDATCRMVLATYLSFDSPSRDSLMMVLRDCVLRHGRLPFGMVIDNGAEFRSTYFEVFTGSRGMLLTRRPPHEPKYGNPVEGFFNVSEMQLIQALEGSSLIFKNARITTKSVDPRNRAVWTLATLSEAIESYCFQIYNQHVNADLGKRPVDAFNELMVKHGIDQLPKVDFNNDFLIQTMPEVNGGTARVQKPCGVKVRGDNFMNVQLTGFIGKDLPVRWDPMDPGRVLVQLPTGWVQCVSRFAKEVEGLSVRDVKFFAQELRQRHSATRRDNVGEDMALGKFIRELKEVQEPAMTRRENVRKEASNVNQKLSIKPEVVVVPAVVPSTPTVKQPVLLPTRVPMIKRKADSVL